MTSSVSLNIDHLVGGALNPEVTENDKQNQTEQAIGRPLAVSMASGSVTLTISQFTRYFAYVCSGASVARTLTVPITVDGLSSAAYRTFAVVNNNTARLTVQLAGSLSPIALEPGTSALFNSNGVDTLEVFGKPPSLTGLAWKDNVRVASAAAGTLATDFENGDTVDGVVLVTGDRILIRAQAAGAENGIYTVNASGAPTRATDFDEDSEVTAGATVFVEEGTSYGATVQVLTNTGAITIGSTALTFATIPVINGLDYFVGSSYGGAPTSLLVILYHAMPKAVDLLTGLSTSSGVAQTAATAQTDFDIQKNGSSIGTMRFAAAGTVASFIFASDVSFAKNDYLEVVAPSVADATLANIAVTIGGVQQ